MRALTKPKSEHRYNPQTEINNLRKHRDAIPANIANSRNIPAVGQAGKLMLASWNIANLGVHKRRPDDLTLIAEILSWFEIVAIQEVADNVGDFMEIIAVLPDYFRYIFNDPSGNDERSAYIYDTRRVVFGRTVGEIEIAQSDRRYIHLPGISRAFNGFSRNPYIVGFKIENSEILLANCHLLYGPRNTNATDKASIERLYLEAYAIARWCDLKRKEKYRWTSNVIALGGFNLPMAEPGDPIFKILTKRGLSLPLRDTQIPTEVPGTADYGQVAVMPGLKSRALKTGVFDFDAAVFPNIFDAAAPEYWRHCVKYYISDHRPMWMQLKL